MRSSLAFAMSLLPIPALAATSLQEIRSAVAHAGANWVPGISNATERYSGKKGRLGLAATREISELAFEQDDFESLATLPSHLDWRDVDGASWLTPVRDQGQCGSCVAFAALSALEGRINVANGTPGLNIDLSEQFLFADIGSCDSGSWPDTAASSLRSRGVPDEACAPYLSGRMGEDSDARPCANVKDRLWKTTGSQSLTSAAAIKQALTQGPVITSMTVYDDFPYYTSGIYQHVTGESLGGHAVTIVGYDDTEGYWIVKNSWSESWGEKGFFRIKYNDVSGVGRSGIALSLANPAHHVATITPSPNSVLKGTTALTLAPLGEGPAPEVAYTLKRTSPPAATLTGAASMGDNVVDLSILPNGIYELSTTEISPSHETPRVSSATTQFRRVYIANTPLSHTVTLESDTDLRKPLKGRVEFRARSSATAVPFTELEVVVRQVGGDYTKKVKLEDPGALIKFGWRTEKAPNGTFEVSLIGRTGTMYEYVAPTLTLQIQN